MNYRPNLYKNKANIAKTEPKIITANKVSQVCFSQIRTCVSDLILKRSRKCTVMNLQIPHTANKTRKIIANKENEMPPAWAGSPDQEDFLNLT